MPGIYDEEQFLNTKATAFRGRLRELIDDVESQYGIQKKYLFYDVEVLKTNSGEALELKDDELTIYCKQSPSPNGKDRAVTAVWNDFSRAHFDGAGGFRMLKFQDVLLEYREVEVMEGGVNQSGEEISPGVFIVPVALVEEGTKRGTKSKAKTMASMADETPEVLTKAALSSVVADVDEAPEEAIDQRLIDKTLALVTEDGTTKQILTREVGKTAAAKKALEAAGGLNTLLAHMVEASLITVSGSAITLFAPPIEDAPEDDQPF